MRKVFAYYDLEFDARHHYNSFLKFQLKTVVYDLSENVLKSDALRKTFNV